MAAPTTLTKKGRDFDPKEFLATTRRWADSHGLYQETSIFTQGDVADSVFYIQEGKVRLTVVSKNGKDATLGILNEGAFFGEGALAAQVLRMGSGTAMTDCELLRIDKKIMIEALHRGFAVGGNANKVFSTVASSLK